MVERPKKVYFRGCGAQSVANTAPRSRGQRWIGFPRINVSNSPRSVKGMRIRSRPPVQTAPTSVTKVKVQSTDDSRGTLIALTAPLTEFRHEKNNTPGGGQ